MEWKQVLTIILTIGIPMLTGFGWIILQLFKMQKDIANFKIEVLKEIRTLDSRLSHVEGYLIGYNQKTGTENLKEKK